MSNKIEQEELTLLSEAYQDCMELKVRLADLTMQQSRTISQLHARNEELGEIQGKIHAKYGDIKVNLETGEY
jgi:hypothetical protein